MDEMSNGCGCPHPPAQQRALFPARDYISGDSFVLMECSTCGLIRAVPPPSQLDRHYPGGYYGEDRRYGGPIEWLLDRLYVFRAGSLERASGLQSGSALDVGCGRGQLLHQLRKHGWRVTGTELSEESARYAREVLHLDVQVGDLVDLRLPAQAYDLVILWHVLEHIPDPAALLREIRRLLRPGGTLLVAVPNFASPEARWSKARWFHLDVPRHLNHFTPQSLSALLRCEGLQLRTAGYFAVEYDLFSFVQTALNMLGIRQNLLYNLLRTRGAKVLIAGEKPTRIEIGLSLLLAPALGVVGALWIPLAALLRQGATMKVYARKPE